jgi:antitoxin component of MazEF toxin-antitoxin module
MIKRISKVGNSHGIIFGRALMELADLKVGDKVNVEIQPGGTITPLRPRRTPGEISKIIKSTTRD